MYDGMPRLLRDRYLTGGDDCVWDLATGDTLPALPDRDDMPMPPAPALIELLDHGRDGAPRWIVIDASPEQAPAVVRRAAADASARGFVPIRCDLYQHARLLAGDDLVDRAVMLIATEPTALRHARMLFIELAARCARPHLLLTIRAASRGPTLHVREARAVYAGRPIVRHAEAVTPPVVVEQLRRAVRADAFVAAGRHASAERLLRDVAAALERRAATTHAARVRIGLGRLLLERGRAVAAAEIFTEAAEAAHRGSDEPLATDARIWQASARIDAGRLTDGEAICRALLAVDAPPPLRARITTTLARVLLWQGRLDEAGALIMPGAADGDEIDAAYADAMRVRVLIATGRLFEAGIVAGELLRRAAGSRTPLVMVLARLAHFRIAAAAGDIAVGEERLNAVASATRQARTPLRHVRARLLWIDLLRRTGDARRATSEASRLRRLAVAAPPLLRRAIEERATNGRRSSIAAPVGSHRADHSATALIHVSNREDDDGRAVRRALEWLAAAVEASRVDLCSAAAGPVSTIHSVGSGPPTHVGGRVLEAGIAIEPGPDDSDRELGVPVRAGSRLLAAVVVRWPFDRPWPPAARDLIDVAAAVIAPRVEALLAAARDASRASVAVPELVGCSEAIEAVRKSIARAAAAPFAVLIEGESGVGKELVARALHHLSPRRERRFCDLNCAALPDELLESELFGHARGAFTGAVGDRAGLFEEADGGTLFLDELADLSSRAQAKLLRVIQQQEIRRVGESFTRKVDVRLVTAANRDMRREAAEGRFRQDLLYRLDVVRIRVPALRERPEDIAVLADHFWRTVAGRVGTQATLTHATLVALSRYHWPGNVREVQNVMSALAVAAPARGRVRPSLLPAAIAGAAAAVSPRLREAREQFERRFVETALARAAGSRTRAARELGLSRQGLLKVFARLGMAGDGDGIETRGGQRL
jgi:DNA-binding NtrC family response regulator